jgi:5-methylthioribose kinase
MERFDRYFLMKETDAAAYVRVKTAFFPPGAELRVKEIGDGNLNYVFRVWDEKSGVSVIVKQAGEQLRISAEMRVSTDRNRIESEILTLQYQYAPDLVPKIYQYDTVMHACVMEDLSSHELMRYALMRHKTFPRFADDITTYMVNTLFSTTDAVMEHKAKKALVKSFINPELCEITEDLVLTEPCNDLKGRNNVFPPNAEFVKKEIYDDTALHLETAKLKFNFLCNAQALIHGDLHTGSIFVKEDSTKVFDPEFAFYGPIGYDVGNVIANLFFAWNNGFAAGEKEFCRWVLECAENVIDLFKKKALRFLAENTVDYMAKTPGFADFYIDSILADTAGYAGTELLRRTVGMAQVKDLTSIADEKKRLLAERVSLLCGKRLIMRRGEIKTGGAYTETLFRAAEAAGSRADGKTG